MEALLNKKATRIIIGLFIAIPFTGGAVMFGLYGILMGIGGIAEMNILLILLGLITILGLLGVSGAWRRLLKPTTEINIKENKKIRVMLFCGFASSFCLLVWSIYFKSFEAISFFVILLIINVFFIYATPKNSNK